eukprot:765855-Hanusia_phi.AAC.4
MILRDALEENLMIKNMDVRVNKISPEVDHIAPAPAACSPGAGCCRHQAAAGEEHGEGSGRGGRGEENVGQEAGKGHDGVGEAVNLGYSLMRHAENFLLLLLYSWALYTSPSLIQGCCMTCESCERTRGRRQSWLRRRYLLETETSLGILNEELGDEVFRPSRHVGGKLEVDLSHKESVSGPGSGKKGRGGKRRSEVEPLRSFGRSPSDPALRREDCPRETRSREPRATRCRRSCRAPTQTSRGGSQGEERTGEEEKEEAKARRGGGCESFT